MRNKIISALSETTELKIEFFDVDSMRIVWHGNYIKYFEIARCRLLEKLGYDYCDMERDGLSWPVIDMRVKYIKPIYFKQVILIQAGIVEYENRLKIQYAIFDKLTKKKLTSAYSVQIAVEHETSEMYFRSPQHVIDKFDRLKGELACQV